MKTTQRQNHQTHWLKQLFVVAAICLPQFIIGQTWTALNNIGATITGTTTNAPIVSEAVCLSMNNKIYVIGCQSFTSTATTARVWEYNPTNDSWAEKAPYPGSGVSQLCGFSIGNTGYVGCGTGSAHVYADFYKYDPSADAWSPIASMPVARTMASGFSVAGKGYVSCGETATMSVYLSDLWEYDPTANAWTQKANIPGGGRISSTAFGIGNNGFMGFGYGGATALKDFYRYDPAANTWSATAVFPGVQRSGARAIVLTNHALLFAGNNLMNLLGDCYSYDATNDSWKYFPQFPIPGRTMVLCGNVGQKIYAGGGTGQSGVTLYNDWWTIETTVGLSDETAADLKLTVYQDLQGDLRIRSGAAEQNSFDFCLFDLSGRTSHRGKTEAGEATIHGLAPGVYFLRTDKGGKGWKFEVR